MKKKILAYSLLGALLLITFSCDREKKEAQKSLTTAEIEFSEKLSAPHADIFCNIFSPSERQEAMELEDDCIFTKNEGKKHNTFMLIHFNSDQSVEKIWHTKRERLAAKGKAKSFF